MQYATAWPRSTGPRDCPLIRNRTLATITGVILAIGSNQRD